MFEFYGDCSEFSFPVLCDKKVQLVDIKFSTNLPRFKSKSLFEYTLLRILENTTDLNFGMPKRVFGQGGGTPETFYMHPMLEDNVTFRVYEEEDITIQVGDTFKNVYPVESVSVTPLEDLSTLQLSCTSFRDACTCRSITDTYPILRECQNYVMATIHDKHFLTMAELEALPEQLEFVPNLNKNSQMTFRVEFDELLQNVMLHYKLEYPQGVQSGSFMGLNVTPRIG